MRSKLRKQQQPQIQQQVSSTTSSSSFVLWFMRVFAVLKCISNNNKIGGEGRPYYCTAAAAFLPTRRTTKADDRYNNIRHHHRFIHTNLDHTSSSVTASSFITTPTSKTTTTTRLSFSTSTKLSSSSSSSHCRPFSSTRSILRLSSSSDITDGNIATTSPVDGENLIKDNVEAEDYDYKNSSSSPQLQQDTIFALSSGFTGQQATAVAVIRISGPQAHTVLGSLLSKTTATATTNENQQQQIQQTPPRGIKLPKTRTAALRKLYYNNQMIDHALVLKFDGPNSFTGEDLIELQCHGSRAVVQTLLGILPKLGCRLADPGEFTQRAFAKGKLDLVQVEALADLLTADTRSQLQLALQQLDGRLSDLYDSWRQQLIKGLAHAEAVIDFGDDERLGEDDILDDDSEQWNVWGNVHGSMIQLISSMENHLEDNHKGELLREGVKIAIVGPPNAGKSSLFNVLAKQDAAIVSPIAGTTRDVIQVSMDLGGIKCTLQDTAGVRDETSDVLEQEGMKRSQAVANKADLVVALVDATESSKGMDIVHQVLNGSSSDENENEKEQERRQLDSKHIMLVLNKLDLITNNNNSSNSNTEIATTNDKDGNGNGNDDWFGGTYEISCVTQEGIDVFLKALTSNVLDRITPSSSSSNSNAGGGEGALITRARHRQHVENAVDALSRFVLLSQQGTMAVDMAAEELRLAASELGRITGAVDVEDVLDVLFSDFCIGK